MPEGFPVSNSPVTPLVRGRERERALSGFSKSERAVRVCGKCLVGWSRCSACGCFPGPWGLVLFPSQVILKGCWMGEVPNWECLFAHRKEGSFLLIQVDDI